MSNEDITEALDNAGYEDGEAARKRLRGFAVHMAVFVVVSVVLGAANFILAPGEWWFVFPVVLWGAPLALHAAYAMGLFRAFR